MVMMMMYKGMGFSRLVLADVLLASYLILCVCVCVCETCH